MAEQQTACAVLMIRPAAFSSNLQTVASNHFQQLSADTVRVQQLALLEFDSAVLALRRAGVQVIVVEDSLEPNKPDAIFPNNWFSTHADGTVVLYPLLAENRRLERRADALELLRASGFTIRNIVDLSALEGSDLYLEGTGSLVLDRANRIAYAALSPRTTQPAVDAFTAQMNYRPVLFEARDSLGRSIYHTNVMLSIGRHFAAVCLECLPAAQRVTLRHALVSTNHDLLELSLDQVAGFAGNILELSTPTGPCVALSESAAQSLTLQQRYRLEALAGPLIRVDLSTIERYGGGSFRCMLAEVHLPRADTGSGADLPQLGVGPA